MKAVTFDCWNTLLHQRSPDELNRARIRTLVRFSAGQLSTVEAHSLLETVWKYHLQEWRAGSIFGPREISKWLAGQLHLSPRESRLLRHELGELTLSCDVVPVPGASLLLKNLKARGLSTGLICDTGYTPGSIIRRILEREELLRYLDVLIFSDDVGFPKPDIRIFQLALDTLEADPRESMHVGDLRRTDIAGAKALGMRAVRFRGVLDDQAGPEADAVIDELIDVLDLISKETGTG